jgi:hypothetical protein
MFDDQTLSNPIKNIVHKVVIANLKNTTKSNVKNIAVIIYLNVDLNE